MEGKIPRLIADVMLGKCAKWLRIMGFNVLYRNDYSDREIIALLKSQPDLNLLTRDTRLHRQLEIKSRVFLVRSNDFREQVMEVTKKFGLPELSERLSRCIRCNEKIVEVPKINVRGRVPPYVFDTQERFFYCPTCDRIYWPGTHVTRAGEELDKLTSD